MAEWLHKHSDFRFFINKTSQKMNLSEFIIEKDYWVTHILKNLTRSEFGSEFVFKGGTCLSKAYNLINRFSEDIDLLMLETNKTKSKTQKEKRLVALRNFVSSLDDLNYTTGNRSPLYAEFRFSFPSVVGAVINSINKEILLEPGYRGGVIPKIRRKSITSHVESMVNNKIDGYDTEPFDINILSIERIFIEKIFAIKEIYDKDGGETLQRKTRHYYDIYKLMQTKEIKALLKNTSELNNIVKDINEIDSKYFNVKPVNWSDLINHIALKPNNELLKSLKQGYKNDKDLYYQYINFEEIIGNIKF